IFDRFDYEFKTSGSGDFGGTFGDTADEMPIDFFTGRGTNGWEFAVPNSFFANADVSKALQNLANFAGDPDGAFPPKQEPGRIHPYPQLTKWGNFSNLRRTLDNNLDSLADQTNEHTAALTLGMLAYNLQYLEAFNYKDAGNRDQIRKLDEALQDLDNLACNPFETTCTDYDRLEDGEVDFYETEDLYGPGLPNVCSPANNTVRDSQDTAIGEKSLNGDADCADPIQTMFVYDTKKAQTNKKVAIARTPGNLPEAYQSGLEQRVKTATNAQLQQRIRDAQLARLLYLKEQTKRDRTYGFRASPHTPGQFQYRAKYFDAANLNDPDAFKYGGISYGTEEDPYDPNNDGTGQVVNFNCNFGAFPTGNNNSLGGNNYFGLFTNNPVVDGANPPKDAEEEQQFIRVATAICGINEDADSDGLLDIAPPANNEDLNGNGKLDGIKYPSLFYLFPLEAHNHLATGLDATKRQPAALVPNTVNPDPYLTDTYIQGLNNNYQQILDLRGVALKPKPIAQWTLPHETINPANACDNDHAAANPNPNCSQYNVIIAKNRDTKQYEAHRIALKDTALFNGREMMNVRVLNLDLEMLKEEKTPGGDTWLAGGNDQDSQAGGIVFAFREDAVREDAIARPAGAAWNACNTVNNITNPGCQTNATDPQDPPVNTANGISPKPVDFYPDPDRRPHGFRLINGSDLAHPNQGGVVNYGLTFVSDNSAYIQGDFNCHKSPGGNCDKPIEEFRQTISDTDPSDANYVNEFYGRTRPQYKVFANPDSDSWRTSELLVDALTILSDNFCDGSIEDGMITVADGINPGGALKLRLGNAVNGVGRGNAGNPALSSIYGCNDPNINYTSYLNQNRPNAPGTPFNGWLRENPADPASPIKLSPNGNPVLAVGEDYTGNYFKFTDGNAAGELKIKPLSKASPQRVNAVIISGTVPFRALQSSGGLHNFPRFLENWDGVPLNISGSLLQLNFSTSATAPWDPDAWEPGGATVAKDQYGYYMAPERLWGYDVALQLVSAGPISTRLINVSKSRSEYYRELPLDDPYINNLRCAAYKGKPIDPRAAANGDCN
ncbi:MAG TPA: hypothetical protein IGS17_21010, partial [Oscillatoriales cyanobacterium M59_W2019_021]|nr:hypothetical protein [Oscillatoriales cyanobacterium M59_W2019_021]